MSRTDYLSLAKQFVQDRFGYPVRIHYYRKEWWFWNGTFYENDSDEDVQVYVTSWLEEMNEETTDKAVREVKSGIRRLSKVKVNDSLEMPIWTDVDGDHPNERFLAFPNQRVDMRALANRRTVIKYHPTPEWFCRTGMDFDYDPKADCPKFLVLIERLVPDPVARAVIQEMFGYSLTLENNMKTMFVLYGDTHTGKSTLTNVLQQLVGKQSHSVVALENFGDQWSNIQMDGKQVNFCGDCDSIDKLAEGALKKATGCDTVAVDEKFKPIYKNKMTAKIIVATNVFPTIRDTTEAMWGRMMVIPMDQRIPEDEMDRTLFDSEKQNWPLRPELPGIFNWAAKGLQRLTKQGKFTKCEAFDKAKKVVRSENCSVTQFVEAQCELTKNGAVTVRQFMTEYKSFSQTNNMKALSSVVVGKILKRLVPNLQKKLRGPRGSQQNYYLGLNIQVLGDM